MVIPLSEPCDRTDPTHSWFIRRIAQEALRASAEFRVRLAEISDHSEEMLRNSSCLLRQSCVLSVIINHPQCAVCDGSGFGAGSMLAIMAAREGLAFEALREALGDEVHVLRDPTRGGVASALNEIAAASNVGIELDEAAIPVPGAVQAACEMLGLDPLYTANEGVLLAIVPAARAEAALAAVRAHPLGLGAAVIGRVVGRHPGIVSLATIIGGSRVVDMLPGDQLPRIC